MSVPYDLMMTYVRNGIYKLTRHEDNLDYYIPANRSRNDLVGIDHAAEIVHHFDPDFHRDIISP